MTTPSAPWGEIIAGLFSGGLLVQIANAFFGRKGAEVKALGDTIGILSDQQDKLSARLDNCEARHEECEDNRARDRRELGEEMDGLKAALRALHAPIPDYKPSDLRRVGRK